MYTYTRSTSIVRPLIISFAVLALISGFLLPDLVRGDLNSAYSYLEEGDQSAWITVALAAAGQDPDPSYLKTTTGSSAIDFEAPILAITAAGEDPRYYPDTNLVEELLGFHTNEQIGDTSTVNDDIFGILALVSAGVPTSDSAVADAKSFIENNQNEDGGWGFAVGGSSDTNMTAAAIAALIAAGSSASDSVVTDAKSYLQGAQNDDGGFPYDPVSQWGTDSDGSSTAWVIWAINALGESPASWTKDGGNPVSFLESLQDEAGWYHYQAGDEANSFTPVTTAYAVIALLGETLPTNIIESETPTFSVDYRIEGSEATVCEGSSLVPDPLELVKIVSESCGFSYTIEDTAWGPYLSAIGDDASGGMEGWMYAVNLEMPQVGAADYKLENGDDILWFFGEFADKLGRITLSDTEIDEGKSVTVTVEGLSHGEWVGIDQAVVFVNGDNNLTDANGKFTFTPDSGSYVIYADKMGYSRTEKVRLLVGSADEVSVDLSVDLGGSGDGSDGGNDGSGGGSGGGSSSVSFSVETGSSQGIDFGSVSKGEAQNKTVTLSNSGPTSVSAGATVSGDEVFQNYLYVDDELWRFFGTQISAGSDKDVDVELLIPNQYPGTGVREGSMTFWAIVNN